MKMSIVETIKMDLENQIRSRDDQIEKLREKLKEQDKKTADIREQRDKAIKIADTLSNENSLLQNRSVIYRRILGYLQPKTDEGVNAEDVAKEIVEAIFLEPSDG